MADGGCLPKGFEKNIVDMSDLTLLSQSYLKMSKDVVGEKLEFEWPTAGNHLRIELEAASNRTIRFFVDVYEGKRESTVLLSASPSRKAVSQLRAGNTPYARIDMASEREALRHINPDGSAFVGNHVHLDIRGYGTKWAIPLDMQSVFSPVDGVYTIQSMFESMLDVNHVAKRLRVKYGLGV